MDAETDIVYLNMFGADIVILSSSEIIADLLDNRSAIYSDKVDLCVIAFIGQEADAGGGLSR